MDKSIISLFLPDGMLDYFDVTSVEKTVDSYTISLAEKNHYPEEYAGDKLTSKGYFAEITVKDFPIRGKACYLKVKRRRWLNEDTEKVVFRNWELVAQGTRMTKEFASFLSDRRSESIASILPHRRSEPVSCKSLGKYFHVNGKLLEEQYAAHLSDYRQWDQLEHAEDYVVFPENVGEHITIDETAVSQGELYTVITNKAARGNKGCLIAIIKGTDSEKVKSILLRKIPLEKRRQVKEVTLDMAASMEQIVTKTFIRATLVTDRFHVQKLAYDAVQEMRIAYRWQAIEQENQEIELSKEVGRTFIPNRLENGDTPKQLLVRSRYLLFKDKSKWTSSQVHRAEILFKLYPQLEQAYELAQKLGHIYQNTKEKGVAFTRLARWYDKVEKAGFKSFNTVSRTIQQHYKNILNFFDRRSTNAAAESFNAKIKAFRSQFRGVRNISFFLYRLSKIYA